VLLRAPAPEPHIEGLRVQIRRDQQKVTRFLQTSPELPMKRLLAMGAERIYQLAPVFRDGDFGPQHKPEFRMLEWYRRGARVEEIMDDCEALLRHLAGPSLETHARHVDFGGRIPRITMDDAFSELVGFSILEAPDRPTLAARLTERACYYAPDDDWETLFYRVYLQKIEPVLCKRHSAFFLTDYPIALGALARPSPEDPRVAERFELFVAGVELANGFGELCDSREQRARFERDRHVRTRRGLHNYPLDERFLDALDAIPSAAGVAVGFDRLMMLLFDRQTIDEVSSLPWSEV
jgi:lysyl-tRNA synthetase class 2